MGVRGGGVGIEVKSGERVRREDVRGLGSLRIVSAIAVERAWCCTPDH